MLSQPSPRRARATLPSPLLIGLSRLHCAARRLAVRRGSGLLLHLELPPAPRTKGSRRRRRATKGRRDKKGFAFSYTLILCPFASQRHTRTLCRG